MENTIHTFKPLYKQNKNRRWQQYRMRVIENNERVFIEKTSGLIGGKARITLEEVKVSKSQESLAKQAVFMGNRIWLNKKQADLFREDMNEEDEEFNIRRDFRPQLAKTFDYEKTKLKFPIVAQRKYDGNRAIMYYDKASTNIVMETRNGHRYLEDCVKYIVKDYVGILPVDVVLDGELFIPGKTFQELQSIVRLQKTPVDRSKDNEFKKLRFYVFDIAYLLEPKLRFSEAYDRLTSLVAGKQNTVLVENDIVSKRDEIKILHDKYVSEGYEGIILRNPNKSYGINKRNSDIMKYKYFIDDEYKIVGLKIEHNNGIELPMWVCQTADGKEFTCRPVGSIDDKREILKNYKDYIGKMLTVKYQELSDDGIPRFGVGKSIRHFK